MNKINNIYMSDGQSLEEIISKYFCFFLDNNLNISSVTGFKSNE